MSHLLVPTNATAPLGYTGPAVPQLSALVSVVSVTKVGLVVSMGVFDRVYSAQYSHCTVIKEVFLLH